MTPAEPPTDEARLRRVLRAVAAGVHPRTALPAIEQRTKKNAAPGVEPGTASAQADYLKGTPAMSTSISKRAAAVRPGDVITAHPDHPSQRVRFVVIAGARPVEGGVLIDYTAPADELPDHTPNGRASGVLMLDADQAVEVEVRDARNGAA